jgi:hypothetical protein
VHYSGRIEQENVSGLKKVRQRVKWSRKMAFILKNVHIDFPCPPSALFALAQAGQMHPQGHFLLAHQ